MPPRFVRARWLVLAACVASACGSRGERPAPPPVVVIQVESPGLAPDEVEQLVVVPIERALAGTPDVESISAVSTPGRGALTVELARGADLWRARSMIAERLQQATLPVDAFPQLLAPAGADVERYVVRSDRLSPAELRTIQDYSLREQLRIIRGVVDVTTCGGSVPTLEIALDPGRLQALDVSLDELTSALSQETHSGGNVIDTGRDVIVRAQGIAAEDLSGVIVKTRADGMRVALHDVAQVARTGRPAPCQTFLDGDAVVTGRISFGAPATRDELAARLLELQALLPADSAIERLGPTTLHVRIATPVADDSDELARVAETIARTAASAEGVAHVLIELGPDDSLTGRLPGEIDVLVALAPDASPPAASARLVDRLRAVPGVTVRRLSEPPASRVVVEVTGADRDALRRTLEELTAAATAIPGIEAAIPLGATSVPRLSITMDRARLATLGLPPHAVMDALQLAAGKEVAVLSENGRILPIVVRWADAGTDPARLASLPVGTANGARVLLGDVATITLDAQYAALLRRSGARYMALWIELDPARAEPVMRELRRRIAELALPPAQRITVR